MVKEEFLRGTVVKLSNLAQGQDPSAERAALALLYETGGYMLSAQGQRDIPGSIRSLMFSLNFYS